MRDRPFESPFSAADESASTVIAGRGKTFVLSIELETRMTDRAQHSKKLRRLGAGHPITRRDFIDGLAVTAAVAASPRVSSAGDLERTAAAPQDRPNYNPPALTGMRGSHPGSFEAATRCVMERSPNSRRRRGGARSATAGLFYDRRSVPVTTMSTRRDPHPPQTSRACQSETGISAP
jgi:hypothetical protein